MNYSKLQDSGGSFPHVDITKFEDGWCQFLAPLPRFDQETYLRLRIMARGPDGLLASLGVRRTGIPYRFLWQETRTFMVTDEGYLHPSGAAHSAMAWFLEDTHAVKSYSPAEGVEAFVFQGTGRTVTVLSASPRHAVFSVPAGAYDLFGNPVPAGQPLGKTLVYVTK